MSSAACMISTTMPDELVALPAFIREIAFLTISMVTEIGGPSMGIVHILSPKTDNKMHNTG